MSVQGNLIGTDASGTNAVGNGRGVFLNSSASLGGTSAAARNIVSGNGIGIELTGSEITISLSGSKMVMSASSISFNDGVVKIGPGGVSLAQGAMTLGIPPV